MKTEQMVKYINHYQDRIAILQVEIEDCNKQIEGHRDQLPRLYYLEMSGHNGYEKGIVMAGKCEDIYDHIQDNMKTETTDFDDVGGHLKGSRLDNSAQVYPKTQSYGNAQPIGEQWHISGRINFCIPLDKIWSEVYELSKVKS